jgi:hypothetical protein
MSMLMLMSWWLTGARCDTLLAEILCVSGDRIRDTLAEILCVLHTRYRPLAGVGASHGTNCAGAVPVCAFTCDSRCLSRTSFRLLFELGYYSSPPKLVVRHGWARPGAPTSFITGNWNVYPHAQLF